MMFSGWKMTWEYSESVWENSKYLSGLFVRKQLIHKIFFQVEVVERIRGSYPLSLAIYAMQTKNLSQEK